MFFLDDASAAADAASKKYKKRITKN